MESSVEEKGVVKNETGDTTSNDVKIYECYVHVLYNMWDQCLASWYISNQHMALLSGKGSPHCFNGRPQLL